MSKNWTTRNTTMGHADGKMDMPSSHKQLPKQGLYLARVVNNSDQQYNGRFTVELLDSMNEPTLTPDPAGHTGTFTIIPTSPFGGTTDALGATDNSKYATSQKSYGMSPQAPPIGATVLVFFIKEQQEGFYMGSVYDVDRNYSIPGLAHAKINERGDRGPASELNPNTKDFQKKIRGVHPGFANTVEAGLAGDYIRGLNSSGMRRDTINNAFGFTTASGHTFVMDDGGSAGTDAGVRIRTASGAQILLHDEAATIYINNAVGSAYIEIDNAGHVDVYSATSFNVHAEEQINFKTGGAFNVEANSINLKSIQAGIKMESATGKIEMHSATDVTISADGNGNLNFSGGNLRATANRIDWNGPPADKAEKPEKGALARNTGVKESIAGRVPEHEPWGGRDTFAAGSAAGAESKAGPR